MQFQPGGARLVYQDIKIVPGPSFIPEEALLDGQVEDLGTLAALCRDLFVYHSKSIEFGPVLAGAIFELRLSAPVETIFVNDGYLNVKLASGAGHMHLGISKSEANFGLDTTGEIARSRMCIRAAFFEAFGPGANKPCNWGLRMWNGAGAQMITFSFKPTCGATLLSELRSRYLMVSAW